MPTTLRHQGSPALASVSPTVAAEVLAAARALQRRAAEGKLYPLLRGKHLGLLCESAQSEAAALFGSAAGELGAQLTRIPPTLSESSSTAEVAQCARLLGRLYDAVECQGIPASLVRRIAAAAGVPVFDGLASAGHPTALLVAELGSDKATADNRRFVLQAVLLGTIA